MKKLFLVLSLAILAYSPLPHGTTRVQLMEFLRTDKTNENIASESYDCMNFSFDLIYAAKDKGIVGIPMWVTMEDGTTHMFVSFPTRDAGDMWVEAETDEQYIHTRTGEYLCTKFWCWKTPIVQVSVY